jgi:hypothetical protein
MGESKIEEREMTMKHAYWAVRCPDCNMPILVTQAGIYDPDRMPVLGDAAPRAFPAPCGACRQTHTYRREELGLVILSESFEEAGK